jgi:pilus assembly protein CpaF
VGEEVDLLDRVRNRLANSSRPAGDLAGTEVARAVRRESGGVVDDVMLADLAQGVVSELSGAGPLDSLLALPGVTDVLVNSPTEVWLDRGDGLERCAVSFTDDAAVRRLAQRLAGAAGRRLDDATPYVDAALPDGTRLHAVLPPITPTTTLSLRVLARRRFDLTELVSAGLAELLRALIRARLAILISGGTGSGKTTLLGAMLGTVAAAQRIVVIEDAAELVIAHPHVVRLVARTANLEDVGEVGLAELVRQALRMRPDRVVVGEFRGGEVVELLAALNTGHEGGAATVHANSAADVPARLIALGALGGLSPRALLSQAASALDVVIQLRRDASGQRAVDEIVLLGAELAVTPIWSARHGAESGAWQLVELLSARDVDVPELLR